MDEGESDLDAGRQPDDAFTPLDEMLFDLAHLEHEHQQRLGQLRRGFRQHLLLLMTALLAIMAGALADSDALRASGMALMAGVNAWQGVGVIATNPPMGWALLLFAFALVLLAFALIVPALLIPGLVIVLIGGAVGAIGIFRR